MEVEPTTPSQKLKLFVFLKIRFEMEQVVNVFPVPNKQFLPPLVLVVLVMAMLMDYQMIGKQ